MKHVIAENLELGFATFAAIVVKILLKLKILLVCSVFFYQWLTCFLILQIVCTILSFAALVTLGELFFFHLILIQKVLCIYIYIFFFTESLYSLVTNTHEACTFFDMSHLLLQGMTTYDYVITMRAQTEPPGSSIDDQDDHTTQPPSPIISVASGRNSLGGSMRFGGASLCTPPNQDDIIEEDVIEHHWETGSVDPDTLSETRPPPPPNRPQVRINPWKLANLDPKKVSEETAKARASSSVLIPLSSLHNSYRPSSNASGISTPGSTTTHDQTNPTALNEEGRSINVVVVAGPVRGNDECSMVWDLEAARYVSSSSQTGTELVTLGGGGSLAANERLNNNNITPLGTNPPPAGFIRHVRRDSIIPEFLPIDLQRAS